MLTLMRFERSAGRVRSIDEYLKRNPLTKFCEKVASRTIIFLWTLARCKCHLVRRY